MVIYFCRRITSGRMRFHPLQPTLYLCLAALVSGLRSLASIYLDKRLSLFFTFQRWLTTFVTGASFGSYILLSTLFCSTRLLPPDTMDGRHGHDDQEKVEMDVYRGYGNNSSFEHPQPYAPYSPLPRPLTPVRPGHFPVDEYGQHVWLQPATRTSGNSDSLPNTPWDSRTPYDSRSASPTLVIHPVLLSQLHSNPSR